MVVFYISGICYIWGPSRVEERFLMKKAFLSKMLRFRNVLGQVSRAFGDVVLENISKEDGVCREIILMDTR